MTDIAATVVIGAQDEAVSKWLLGSNITAMDSGQGFLLDDDYLPCDTFDSWMLARAKEVAPTLLAYPNFYDTAWTAISDALTPAKFRELCGLLGSDALLTLRTWGVNWDCADLSAHAAEAVAWVAAAAAQGWSIKGWQVGCEDYYGNDFLNLPPFTCQVDATADTVTFVNHGFGDGDTLSFTTSYGGLAAGVTYYVRDRTDDTFKVALTADGAAVDITATGAMAYTTTLTKINRVHWYRQVLSAFVPALKAAGASPILAEVWTDRWGHKYSGAIGTWNGHLFANFNDMVVEEFGGDIDGIDAHFYPCNDGNYPLRMSMYWTRNICQAFTVPETATYTIKVQAYTLSDTAKLRVQIGASATPDVDGILTLDAATDTAEFVPTVYTTPAAGYTPAFHEYSFEATLTAGTHYIDVSRYSPTAEEGTLVLGTVLMREAGTADPWLPVWFTHRDGWRWVFAKNTSYEDELTWLETYGKPIWSTQASSNWNSTYRQDAIQFRVGAALVCAQQIGMFARHGVKARLQWDLGAKTNYANKNWDMIDYYTHANPEQTWGGEVRAEVDPRGQMMQFLHETGFAAGGYCHVTTVTADQDAFWSYPESNESWSYIHYNLVDATAVKDGATWKVLLINLDNTRNAVVDVSGFDALNYDGTLRVLAASLPRLPEMLDGQTPTLFDAITFDSVVTTAFAVTGGSASVTLPPASVAVLTLAPIMVEVAVDLGVYASLSHTSQAVTAGGGTSILPALRVCAPHCMEMPMPGSRLNDTASEREGLVGAWLLNDTGVWMQDARGQTHGTFNSPEYVENMWHGGVTPWFDRALYTDQWVLLDATPLVGTNRTMSVSAWIWLTAYPLSGNTVYIMAQRNDTYNRWSFAVNSSGQVYASHWCATTTAAITSGMALNLWTPYHVVMVYDDSTKTHKLYINGKEDTPSSSTTGVGAIQSNATQQVTIGNRYSSASPYKNFDGAIWNVAMWNRVLRADEVQHLFLDPYCLYAGPGRDLYGTGTGSVYDVRVAQVMVPAVTAGRFFGAKRSATTPLVVTATAVRNQVVERAAAAAMSLVASVTGNRYMEKAAAVTLAVTASAGRVYKRVFGAALGVAVTAGVTAHKFISQAATATLAVTAGMGDSSVSDAAAAANMAVSMVVEKVMKLTHAASQQLTVYARAVAARRYNRTAGTTLTVMAQVVEGGGIWLPVTLTSSTNFTLDVTGKTDADVTVQYADAAGVVRTKAMTPSFWREVGGGRYELYFQPGELTTKLFTYWVSGAGLLTYYGCEEIKRTVTLPKVYHYTVTDSLGVPVTGVAVWVSTDADGEHVISGPQFSDASGNTTWTLFAGSYYFWCEKVGYTFNSPDLEVV